MHTKYEYALKGRTKMQNIWLTLEYDGTRYLGWQRPIRNNAARTVSYKLSEVLRRMTGESPILNCAVKTEPGVHALAQEVSFQTSCTASPEEFVQYLNTYLPQDIAIRRACQMPERFRADLNAKSRTYIYHLCILPVQDIFKRQYALHQFPGPDAALMQQAAMPLIGKHDFKYFASGHTKKNTKKELFDIQINTTPEKISLTLTADDFLPKMPRLIIGTLLDIGLGIRRKDTVESVLTGVQAPSLPCDPKGLFLKHVFY